MPFLFHRCSMLSGRQIARVLAPLEIDVKHFGLLCSLHTEGPQSQGWMGDRLGIDRTTMVDLVDGLERRGLVRRQRNPDDRRSYRITVTPAGEAMWQRARTLIDERQASLLEALDADEQETLRALLTRFVEAHEGD